MSLWNDDDDVRTDELLRSGRPAPGDEPLAGVLGGIRALLDEPAPPPTPALSTLLRDGLPTGSPTPASAHPPRWRRVLRWGTGLGVTGKILLGASVAAAGVTGAAAIPGVPDAVQVPVRDALSDLGHLLSGPETPVPAPPATSAPGTSASGDGDSPPGPDSPSVPPRATPAVPEGDDERPATPPADPQRPSDVPTGRPTQVPVGPPSDLPTPSAKDQGDHRATPGGNAPGAGSSGQEADAPSPGGEDEPG